MLTRRSFLAASASSAACFVAPRLASANSVNGEIRVGLIGCGGRGKELIKWFTKIDGVRLTAFSDVDENHLGKVASTFPAAKTSIDPRGVIESDDVDAVVIATGNHWHCLAAIWACRAGKDVYVEKPLGHNLAEQRALVKVAAETGRIVQVGTQQRSDPARMAAHDWLHKDKAIGELSHVVACRIGQRKPIGLREEELPIPKAVDYKLWLGPAKQEPLYRSNLHYDWHWDWNTGSGEMGNWGVHILDDLRSVAHADCVEMPTRVVSAGARVGWSDAGETPNLHVAHFINTGLPVQFLLSNLEQPKQLTDEFGYQGPSSGYTVYGEGGFLRGQRGTYELFDEYGKLMKTANGTSGTGHAKNFITAVRSRDESVLNAPLSVAHASSAWCHFANIAALQGDSKPSEAANQRDDGWRALSRSLQAVARQRGADTVPAGVIDIDSESGLIKTRLTAEALVLETREATPGFDPLTA